MTPEQQAEARKMFFDQFNNCVQYQHKDFPGQIFWMDKTRMEWVFNYDLNYATDLWIRYDFWKKFETKFDLNYHKTRDLLKPLVDEAFKKEGLTPEKLQQLNAAGVEEAFKKKSAHLIDKASNTPLHVLQNTIYVRLINKENYAPTIQVIPIPKQEGGIPVALYQGELRQLIYQAMALTAQRNNLEITPEASEKYIEQAMDTFLRCLRTNNTNKTINILS
jgi:hypothetical protein